MLEITKKLVSTTEDKIFWHAHLDSSLPGTFYIIIKEACHLQRQSGKVRTLTGLQMLISISQKIYKQYQKINPSKTINKQAEIKVKTSNQNSRNFRVIIIQ